MRVNGGWSTYSWRQPRRLGKMCRFCRQGTDCIVHTACAALLVFWRRPKARDRQRSVHPAGMAKTLPWWSGLPWSGTAERQRRVLDVVMLRRYHTSSHVKPLLRPSLKYPTDATVNSKMWRWMSNIWTHSCHGSKANFYTVFPHS